MSYKSNLPQITALLRRARFAGLLAMAAVVVNAVKGALQGGFTSGRFVTGFLINSVTHGEPEENANGAFILIGTNVQYAIYWELGHLNIFTRKFERVEKWIPALFGTRAEQLAAYERAFGRVWSGGGGGGFGQVAASPR